MNKFVDIRPFADPLAAAQKLMEIANAVDPVQDGRIFIELINGPFLYNHKGSPAEYGTGLKLAIERGWLWKHESGTYVKFTQSDADLFACSDRQAGTVAPGSMHVLGSGASWGAIEALGCSHATIAKIAKRAKDRASHPLHAED